MINLIADNKEWLFSGVGITVFTVLFFLFKKLFWNRSPAKDSEIAKKSDLSINVEKSVIKHSGRNDYFALINMTITANNGPRTLRRLWLKAKSNHLLDENQGPLYTDKGMQIEQALPLLENDLLQLSDEKITQKYRGMESTQFAIRDKVINEGHTISLSIVCKLLPARMPDGWEDMDLDGWKIIVEYDQNEKTVASFSFLIHKSSEKHCVQWAYTGFSGHLLPGGEHDYG